MKPLLLICAFIALAKISNSQPFDYSTKSLWREAPEKHSVNSGFTSASAVGILDDRKIEYKVEGKEMSLTTTYHRIIRINDDKGIEMFNKVYVPMSGSTITDIKARTVLSNGKVIDFPTSKIKEIEEDGRTYKLFAMEGVEKGSEIEYTYTTKRAASFFGMEIYQTANIPYQKVMFKLVVPKFLKFDAKGYNGIKVSKDSVIDDNRVIVALDENVSEIDEEKYAVRDPHLERVEYKLSYNLGTSADVRLYTWKEFAKRAYALYTTITPKEEKALATFINQIKKNSAASSEEARILGIEDYIKSTINVDKQLVGDDGGAIENIVKLKSANSQGVIKLFAAIFEKEAIHYQIVFVGRRDEFLLDEDIENWNLIDEVVFYFPSTGKYLSPFSVELRYPYIPAYWAGSKGLFLKGTSIGTFKTAIGSFNEVGMEPYEKHGHNMEAVVSFDATLDTVLIHNRQIFTGYSASIYRPIYTFLPKDKQDEANLEIIKSVSKSTDVKNIKVENPELTNFIDNKPLIISADIKSTDLIERAGNKVLLKIGEIIGPQVEMYQEKPRRLPVELPYPHVLQRKISFTIPNGYSIKNLSDLNLSVEHKDGAEATMGFVSTYAQTGNIVTIDITESYKKIKYPLSQFEDFKKVINAAADFNKIVLVLEKKS